MFPWLDGLVPPLLLLTLAALLATARRLLPAMVILFVLTAGIELAMGRPPVYRHGPVRLWSGDVRSDQNSQQLADPYTFTHVEHGLLFYALTHVVLGSQPPVFRLFAAVALESAWEVYENTDTVVERYRAETISLGYYGDSVVNSLVDILACVAGFLLARRLPVAASVVILVATEAALALWIRDNLALNVIMLVYPLQALKNWQMGGS